VITQNIITSGSPTAFTITGGAHTTLAATLEAPDVYLNLARNVQFATGSLNTQRAIIILPPSYGFVAASALTHAYTVNINGGPSAGTNATITNSYGLSISGPGSGAGTLTNGFALYAQESSGGTNNYAAQFLGKVKFIQSAASVTNTLLDITQANHTGGSPVGVLFTGGAHTTLATGEVTDINFNLARNIGIATGSYANQRSIRIQAPTIVIATSGLVTDASTVNISGAPIFTTPGTATNSHGVLISSNNVTGVVTNSYGLTVNAQTGATNNFSAQFLGGSGVRIDIGTYLAAPADSVLISSKNSSDGTTNATLALSLEQAVEAIGTFTASHKIKVWINNVEYWLQLDAV